MAGIYIHIPFCKQACYYCDFHFSTSLKKKDELFHALIKELRFRKQEFHKNSVQTIYFGGGTPSLLTVNELEQLVNEVYKNYSVDEEPEITLEANPDDLPEDYVKDLAGSPVNRLSIGIQSFFDTDLKLMNRVHSAAEATKSLARATQFFENISIDLIYGVPDASDKQWLANIEKALSFGIPHISSYALTVEPKTALASFITKGIIKDVDEEQAQRQFYLLVDRLQYANFIHYELSNFGKAGFFSENNTAYWLGKPYLGIGPSAHSFTGKSRSWNVRNNTKYIKALNENRLPNESEALSKTDRYNEAVMTGLRTMWGVSLKQIEKKFGNYFKQYLLQQAQPHIERHLLYIENENLLTTKKGKFLCDGIASDLFKLNL